MKIQYCSDLHLEFQDNWDYLKKKPIVPTGDILLLAGDILPLNEINGHTDFFDFVSDNFETVYWLPGNHEHYGNNIELGKNSYETRIRENVFLLNNKKISHSGFDLIFTTLWSKIDPQNEWSIQRSVQDFYRIKVNQQKLTTQYFNRLHEDSMDFLKGAIHDSLASTKIVVTHHVPTLKNYPPQYRFSDINQAFVVELHDFILDSDIDYWIYGHHHINTPNFQIGQTNLLTNQLGYIRFGEHYTFASEAIFTI